jgi:predicted metal-dependent RNase
MISLTFYGGVNEIGDNKILLEDKDTRVFLDFSKGFGRKSRSIYPPKLK